MDESPPRATKPVHVRDVPAEVVDVLQARAGAAGISLTAYLRNVFTEMASLPTMAEIYQRANQRDWGVDHETIVTTIRELRDGAE